MTANPVYEATKFRCIEEQNDAAASAFLARRYLDNGLLGRAAQEQREAAYHFEQAEMRLSRLIGAA
jgi:hypothetical protein